MRVSTGLEVAAKDGFARFRGQALGLLCNQASISSTTQHILELMLPHHRAGHFDLHAVFGPQHGLFGHTQDNMVEWEAEPEPDSRTGLTTFSLYGKHRSPAPAMLQGIERFVVDVQDVGARYYTFIWTMALCMEACEARGIPMTVLDRPNPIGGTQVEGTVLLPEFSSFVGLHPLPMRHGMTVGEIALHLQVFFYPNVELDVVAMDGWRRPMHFSDTGLPWAMPSPNMPTPDTALVYPGMCLLEATNLSEGRGTTRPFEMFGAPFIDGWLLCAALNAIGLPGVHFRPVEFQPTFSKHAGKICEGAFIHVTDRSRFEPVMTAVSILQEVRRLSGEAFQWNDPPYEYEFERLPIDVLAGNDWLRRSIEGLESPTGIRARFKDEIAAFQDARSGALLYD